MRNKCLVCGQASPDGWGQYYKKAFICLKCEELGYYIDYNTGMVAKDKKVSKKGIGTPANGTSEPKSKEKRRNKG